jgi:hypothetical protein
MTREVPFDPGWLEAVAETCDAAADGSPALVDLYLEQRLEISVVRTHASPEAGECRSEGAAARWKLDRFGLLDATTGVSRLTLEALLGRFRPDLRLPNARPLPIPELDAPRGWRDWAVDTLASFGSNQVVLRYISRRAVVIRPGQWHAISSPALISLHSRDRSVPSLLATSSQARLPAWLEETRSPPPSRPWSPPSHRSLPALFTNGTGGALLHELIGHMSESDLVCSGASPLARLRDAELAPPSLSVRDDPLRSDLPGAFTCDDEGVPAAAVSIVDRGVLSGWLCDLEGSRRLGEPPGRGRRAALDSMPTARLSNLVVAPGSTPPDALEQDLSHGLLVTRIGGASVDPASGRVVVLVERGWEIRHGRRRRPLAPFHLVGRVLEVLASIEPDLGTDPTPDWRLGWCAKGGALVPTGSDAPTMLLHRLEVL